MENYLFMSIVQHFQTIWYSAGIISAWRLFYVLVPSSDFCIDPLQHLHFQLKQ